MTEARHFLGTWAGNVGQVGVAVAIMALEVIIAGCPVVVAILGKGHLIDIWVLLFKSIALVRFPLFHIQ